MIDFSISPELAEVRGRIAAFMDEYVYENEAQSAQFFACRDHRARLADA
jgi:hypothetical protein